eukprot:10004645-Alexandrium_andersonii.AAC.1
MAGPIVQPAVLKHEHVLRLGLARLVHSVVTMWPRDAKGRGPNTTHLGPPQEKYGRGTPKSSKSFSSPAAPALSGL